MLKVLVTGCTGQVGSELQLLSPLYVQKYHFTFIDSKILDLKDLAAIHEYFNNNSYDVIINCAAYTAVDSAELENVLADDINYRAVEVLAQIAKDKKISLIHLSTDYVFNGKNQNPYKEADFTDPINAYGRSKQKGEEAMLAMAPANSIIIRTSWLYSRFGKNFVKTMIRLGQERESLGVIFDQVGSPTYAYDLAKAILDIIPKIHNSIPEIFNYTNEGETNWFEFAKAIFELSNSKCVINAITTAQYPTAAKRPQYSLLDTSKIKNKFGLTIPHWKDSLKECLQTSKIP